jgi:hypothetical protein
MQILSNKKLMLIQNISQLYLFSNLHLSLLEYPSYLSHWLSSFEKTTRKRRYLALFWEIFFWCCMVTILVWVNSHRVSQKSVLNTQSTIFKRSIYRLLKEIIFSFISILLEHAEITFETSQMTIPLSKPICLGKKNRF